MSIRNNPHTRTDRQTPLMVNSDPSSSVASTDWPAPQLLRWGAGESEVKPWPLEGNTILVWVVTLDDENSQYDGSSIELNFGSVLSSDELARANRFIKPLDRVRFARCRSVLREILGLLVEQSPQSIRFGSGPHGKPYVSNEELGDHSCPIKFNVSHSGGLALIAATKGREVGVDLEQIRPIREHERIVGSFFTEVEQRQFGTIAEPEKDGAFMRGWTRKEAILKGIGKGLAGGPARFETMFGTSALSKEFQPITPCPTVDNWILWEAAIGSEYVATVAASLESKP